MSVWCHTSSPPGPAAAVIFALAVMLLSKSVGAAPDTAVRFDLLLAEKPQQHLSAYNLFADGMAQRPNHGVVPYDLITPLFSDYAMKYRFVAVPGGGKADYHETDVFSFPVGTALVKTFAYPADFRAPDTNIQLIEPRLLIKRDTGWVAYPYVWNAEQTEATLKIAGARQTISFVNASGGTTHLRYVVPNINQCKGCHLHRDAIVPLGPKARNLNHEFRYDSGARNQIAHWTAVGILAGAPEPRTIASVPDWRDENAPLEARARAYLDVNCGHCHRPQAPADTSGLFLNWEQPKDKALGLNKPPVAAGRGSGGHAYDIVPGDAAASILVFRMRSLDPGIMMPELGRSLAHREGIDLVTEWINALDAQD